MLKVKIFLNFLEVFLLFFMFLFNFIEFLCFVEMLFVCFGIEVMVLFCLILYFWCLLFVGDEYIINLFIINILMIGSCEE